MYLTIILATFVLVTIKIFDACPSSEEFMLNTNISFYLFNKKDSLS